MLIPPRAPIASGAFDKHLSLEQRMVLDAAVQWIRTCLIEDRSVFSEGSLWTAELVDQVHETTPEGRRYRRSTSVGTVTLKLPRGTDAYLKVVDQNANAQFGGHTAHLSLDYLVINRQKVTVQTDAWPHTFVIPTNRPVNPRRPARPEDSVLWPIGDTKWFDVTGQTEVPRSVLVANSQPQADSPVVSPIGNTRYTNETPHDSPTTKVGTAKRSTASPVLVTQPQASLATPPPATGRQTPTDVTSTAQAAAVPDLLAGPYEGTYNCAGQGSTGLRLDVTQVANGSLTATFQAAISNLPAYDLTGNYDPTTKQFFLTPVRWKSRPPAGYTMVGMQGVFDAAAESLWGKITDPRCGPFVVKCKAR